MEGNLTPNPANESSLDINLRDHFAALALAGLLSCRAFRVDYDIPTRAKIAYKMADAMLEARKS